MVVSKQQRELGPLENAVNSIETKTQELLELVEEFEDRSRAEAVNISPLSMAINGVIDAAVNGGIVKYQEAFLIGDENNEKYSLDLKDKLRNGLRQQLEVIEKGLRLHARLITPEMRGLQEKLDSTCFCDGMLIHLSILPEAQGICIEVLMYKFLCTLLLYVVHYSKASSSALLDDLA